MNTIESLEYFKIINCNPNYDISNFGLVRNRKTGKLLYGCISNTGYPVISLSKEGKAKTYLIHRLVAEAFIDNPNNYDFIDHIDRNKINNHYKNLRWATHSMNMRNKKPHGKIDIAGISFHTTKQAYIATINGNDKRHKKEFSIKQYGNPQRALLHAKIWRKSQELKFDYF